MTEQTKNHYEIENNIVKLTVFNKKGKAFTAQFDLEDLETVKNAGVWHAQWHKDFNNYIIQTSAEVIQKGKKRYIKPTLQSTVLKCSPNAPIRHLNGDLLDNRKINLEIYNRRQKNEYDVLDNGVIAIHLKDRYGNLVNKALISAEDLDKVVNETYTWVCQKKANGQPYAIAHTEMGRVYLDTYLTNCQPGYRVYHINKNPLDNRRQNLEVKELELQENNEK